MSKAHQLIPQYAGLRTSSLNLSATAPSPTKATAREKLIVAFRTMVKREKDAKRKRKLEKLRNKLLTNTLSIDDAVIAALELSYAADYTKGKRHEATRFENG